MATNESVSELRVMLGESIPTGGSETDTLFTDVQIAAWVDGTKTLNYAALKGWEAKMASFSNLVTVTDGAAMRQLSDLMTHAQQMIAYYKTQIRGAGRTTVGKIVRSWTP